MRIPLLLPLFLLASSLPAQSGVPDQSSPFGSASFNGSTSSLVWQQQVRVGVAGPLEGFELELYGPLGAQVNVGIRVGDGWNTGPLAWQTTYRLTSVSAWERVFFDTLAAALVFQVGDTFVLEIWGNDTGTNVGGNYVAPPGVPLYPEQLYLNGPGCYADCGWRIGFQTYVLTGPSGPTLTVTNLVAGQTATLFVDGAAGSGLVGFAYSIAGGGPTQMGIAGCGPLTVALSQPIVILPPVLADPGGNAMIQGGVPAGTTGFSVWFQALDVSNCLLTNPVADVVG